MRPRREKKTSARKTPAWIVSFSDMTTLLLAFFIMLQAFATTRDPDLFGKGQDGFRRAIAGLGIPDWLFGQRDMPSLGHRSHKSPTEEDPENVTNLRVIDAQDERIRQLFEDLRRLRESETSDYGGPPARLLSTPIAFGPNEAALSETGRDFLRDFALQLAQAPGEGAPYILVLGRAPDAAEAGAQWVLSARRAAAVEAFLAEIMPAALTARGARVGSWGLGAGSDAPPSARLGTGETFIALAIMDASAKE